MYQLLVIAIGVFVVLSVVLVGRLRRADADPSSSVQSFHRALSAMEPGTRPADDDAEPPAQPGRTAPGASDAADGADDRAGPGGDTSPGEPHRSV